MKHKIVCVIDGGVIQSCHSDWFDSTEIGIVIVDYDLIDHKEKLDVEIEKIIDTGNCLY